MIESAAGGSAAIMVSLAIHAAKRGHEVHVLYSPDRADPAVISALKEGGCTSVQATPMRRAVGPRDALDGLALRGALRALGRLDVIHSHSSKAGALARTFGRVTDAVQIYSPHGFYTMTGEAPFYVGLVERWLAPLTTRIIAVSAFEREHAIELGIAPQKVSVIPNGIAPYRPLEREEARNALGIPDDRFVVGFVGRLAAQKDPLAAVAAIQAVDPSLDATLAIIGDGDLATAVDAAACLANGRVAMCGPRDAKPLMSAFDCLLCTSRYEGMPVTFLEALNCGVPIVSYPVGGTQELVHDGRTGWVTEPSPAAAARAIERIASLSAGDRRKIAETCRAVAEQHSAAAMGDATLALYHEVAQARVRPAAPSAAAGG